MIVVRIYTVSDGLVERAALTADQAREVIDELESDLGRVYSECNALRKLSLLLAKEAFGEAIDLAALLDGRDS